MGSSSLLNEEETSMRRLRCRDFATTVLLCSLIAPLALEARADGAALYRERCASCHGESGAADTAIGRALSIPSFAGTSWSRDQVRKLLAESASHARVAPLSEAELDALMGHLETLAAPRKPAS
jgi:mono/diheme cytochrome c family protein